MTTPADASTGVNIGVRSALTLPGQDVAVYCLVSDRQHDTPDSDASANYAFMFIGTFADRVDAWRYLCRPAVRTALRGFEPRLARLGQFMPVNRIMNPTAEQRVIPDATIAETLGTTCNLEESLAAAQTLPARVVTQSGAINNTTRVDSGVDPLQLVPPVPYNGQTVALLSFVTRPEHPSRTPQVCNCTALALHGAFGSEAAAQARTVELERAGQGDVAIWRIGVNQWELLPPMSNPKTSRKYLRHILRRALKQFNEKNQDVDQRTKELRASDKNTVYRETAAAKRELARLAAAEGKTPGAKGAEVMEALAKMRDDGYKPTVSVGKTRVISDKEFADLKLDNSVSMVELS